MWNLCIPMLRCDHGQTIRCTSRNNCGDGLVLGRARVAVVALTLVLMVLVIHIWNFGPREYATSLGEQRTLKLPDASLIYLNTHSSVLQRGT